MRYAVILAILAGAAVALQVSFTSASQRALGPAVLVTLSALTTGLVALAGLPLFRVPELGGRIISYAVASGVLSRFRASGIRLQQAPRYTKPGYVKRPDLSPRRLPGGDGWRSRDTGTAVNLGPEA